MSISGERLEFTLVTPEGVSVSFDALGQDAVLYEIKTGHRPLVFQKDLPGRQERIEKIQTQARTQLEVATRCGYPLVWIFNEKDVQQFFDGIIEPKTRYIHFPCSIDSE